MLIQCFWLLFNLLLACHSLYEKYISEEIKKSRLDLIYSLIPAIHKVPCCCKEHKSLSLWKLAEKMKIVFKMCLSVFLQERYFTIVKIPLKFSFYLFRNVVSGRKVDLSSDLLFQTSLTKRMEDWGRSSYLEKCVFRNLFHKMGKYFEKRK